MPSRPTAPARAPSKARRASLGDVARLADVSPGTVSRALSRPEMISAETRERVLAAAARLGYVTNGAARALAMRRTLTVGALVPRFGTSSFPTMVQALEATLAAAGYTLLISAPDHRNTNATAILRAMLERGVDAVALLGTEQPAAVFELLASHGTPYVLMWARGSRRGPCVGFDEAAAAALAVDHLAALGHRRIGFIGGRTADNERARARQRGVFAAAARNGLTLPAAATIETEYGLREGFEAMQQVLRCAEPVSAVVCGNDYLAAGALSALDHAGVAVPAAMSVASFNDNEFAAYVHPPLTTVRVPIAAIGQAAAEHLLAQLRGEKPPVADALPVELVVRASTAAAPRRARK